MRQRTPLVAVVMLVGMAMIAATPGSAQSLGAVNDRDTVVLHGNISPLARPDLDIGATPLSLPMERMILSLAPRPGAQAALDKLLAAQQDPASPYYHQWLTPSQFGDMFGPSAASVNMVVNWLTLHGFAVEEVATSRMWINFSGTVRDVEAAFNTQIHDFDVDGVVRHANVVDPTIPRAFVGLVNGIVTLNNFPKRAYHSQAVPVSNGREIDPDYTSGSNHYLSPGDFAVIYNVNPLYSAGIDGTGQTVAIVGRTHPSSTNWTTFRSTMGLPANAPQVIVNGTDPGDLGSGEDGEADLDVEWSGAVAKNATVKFVISKSTSTTDGVDLSAQYIVNNNLAPVMSTSFGQCESSMGSTENTFYNNLWSQAASQGITSFVSSGDSGASGCDGGSSSSGTGLAVSGLSSTPYNVAVGGTQFNEGSGTYWSTTNTGYTSALSYIPEVAWNESGNVSGGSGLWSTGGGKSTVYSKPSWQVCSGVPADGKRDVPDVSLTAASHDGYLVETQGALYVIGGTSASSPSFAGLMALIVQKTGSRQGNANTRFYQLGNAQYASGGTVVYHDTTSGNNSVPGVTGYSCTTGYDLATGLGSVDANALANAWGGTATPDFTISASPSSVPIAQGSSGTSTITTAVSGGFNNAISLSASGLPTGASASFNPTSIAAPGSGTSTLTITVGASTATGTYTVTVTGTGGSTTHTAAVSLTVTSSGGGTTLFSDGFESTGWSTAQVSGTAGAWTLAASGTHPSATPHGGSKLADFNSYTSASGSQTRIYRSSGFAVGSYGTVTLTFWMYHDTGYSTYADKVQPQVSTNGTTWTNVGSAVNRYTGSTGWAQATVDVSAYSGQTVYLGFLGISAYGNDCYIDDVMVTASGTASPDFAISASPTSVSAAQGSSGTTTVTTTVSGGFSNAISLSASGLPSGATATFNPTSIAAPGSGSATLTLTAGSSTTTGTYTVTITGTGGGKTHTATVSFTVTSGGGTTTLFSNGFESATGWASAQVSGTAGKWTRATSATHPTASPHGGSYLVYFNSYTSASGSQTRYYRTSGFAVSSSYSTVTLTFWMYHDTAYSTYADKVQPQVSTNGSTWANLGSAINRYDGSTGWKLVTLDLSAYKGQTVYLGFLGISAYGDNCLLDDVTVTAQ